MHSSLHVLGEHSSLCRETFGDTARWATTKEVREEYEAGSATPFVRAAVRVVPTLATNGYLYDSHAEVSYGIGQGGCFQSNWSVNIYEDGKFNVGICYATAFCSSWFST